MAEIYLVITNGIVANRIIWNGDEASWQPPESATVMPAPDGVGVGWLYDGAQFSPPPPAPIPEREFTWLEFIDLFTSDEQIKLVGASMVDANVKLFYDKAVGAQGIYLSDPRTIEGIGLLTNAGLLTPQRRDQVLAGILPGSV